MSGLAALVPMQLVINVAFPVGAFAASVMFWNTFGPSFVLALIGQPGP